MEESEIDFDVQKYSQLLDTNNSIEYIGTSNQYHDLFHSDILILKKILQFKGKKLALLKFDKIACVFLDFNFLIRALFELDFQHYSDSSPVDAIIDIDTCQAVYLNYTEAYQVYSNF